MLQQAHSHRSIPLYHHTSMLACWYTPPQRHGYKLVQLPLHRYDSLTYTAILQHCDTVILQHTRTHFCIRTHSHNLSAAIQHKPTQQPPYSRTNLPLYCSGRKRPQTRTYTAQPRHSLDTPWTHPIYTSHTPYTQPTHTLHTPYAP